jgi:hypothetical protein
MTVARGMQEAGGAGIRVLGIGLLLLGALGCGSSKPAAVKRASVDAEATATAAMEQFDASKDAALDKAELAKCPPLAAAVAGFDADSNSQLSAKEIADGVTRLYSSGSAVTGVDCTVTLSGRPLPGAIMKLRPAAILGESVQPAEGATNEAGVAKPGVAAEHLPENLQSSPLAQPGLYHVEITHPEQSLPSRYNTETELAFVVDPVAREGTSARFDLKP